MNIRKLSIAFVLGLVFIIVFSIIVETLDANTHTVTTCETGQFARITGEGLVCENLPKGGINIDPPCENGEILKYNSGTSEWACGSDSVSVDSSCTSGQIIKYDSATSKWKCITENIDVGLECPTGQIIKYDANRKADCSQLTQTTTTETYNGPAWSTTNQSGSSYWRISGGTGGNNFNATKIKTSIISTSTISASTFFYHSDKNKKKNIKLIQNPLDTVKSLNGYTFTFKKNNKDSIGLIAQEVEEVLPELVDGEEGEKSVDYGSIVALLIEAMKEQQAQIEKLQAEVEELKNNK